MTKHNSVVDKFSLKATKWVGTSASLIIHSIGFIGIFGLAIFNVNTSNILLILTTAVSLEAIYLAIFIQMTVNRHEEHLEEISDDTGDILEDTEELTEEDN